MKGSSLNGILPVQNEESMPLQLQDLEMLHADAVKAKAPGYSTAGQMWFKAIDAKTLDKVITEMNEMNRWFAKVTMNYQSF